MKHERPSEMNDNRPYLALPYLQVIYLFIFPLWMIELGDHSGLQVCLLWFGGCFVNIIVLFDLHGTMNTMILRIDLRFMLNFIGVSPPSEKELCQFKDRQEVQAELFECSCIASYFCKLDVVQSSWWWPEKECRFSIRFYWWMFVSFL